AAATTTASAGTAAAASARRARDVRAARHADARALVLSQHLPRAHHQLLLGDLPLFERHHHDAEVREARVDVLHHALQRRLREHFFLDRLDELFGALIA